ncbi:MAG: riboflavin biosynthesis protein [Chloroflexota bacterium]|jgi:riboflavin kinase/FMN adenylyltransferase|nr:MAG: riboflavin biosynthesis protein [Chloroflexota bacterium]
MERLYTLDAAALDRPSFVTIGVFDGVHAGHQHLIRRLVAEAHAAGQLAVVVTFFPHPDVVLRGLQGRYYLTTPQQKADLLLQLGVDYVITYPFSREASQVRAADFVDVLLKNLRLNALWVGADFAMGYKREGNLAFLKTQGQQKGFAVREIDLVANDGEKISSSVIRRAVMSGEVEKARKWLGRAYSLVGEVIHGEGRGRQIGFPTANMNVWDEQVIPANGIYAGWAWVDGQRFMAATNVGIRPTFEGATDVTVEPYLLDFDRDIYGQQIEISFEKLLRPEAKFNSIQALIEQIARDVDETRVYLQTLP